MTAGDGPSTVFELELSLVLDPGGGGSDAPPTAGLDKLTALPFAVERPGEALPGSPAENEAPTPAAWLKFAGLAAMPFAATPSCARNGNGKMIGN